jgi:hypothetical protein
MRLNSMPPGSIFSPALSTITVQPLKVCWHNACALHLMVLQQTWSCRRKPCSLAPISVRMKGMVFIVDRILLSRLLLFPQRLLGLKPSMSNSIPLGCLCLSSVFSRSRCKSCQTLKDCCRVLQRWVRWGVRCAFFDRNSHSRMPLVPTPLLRLKRACV